MTRGARHRPGDSSHWRRLGCIDPAQVRRSPISIGQQSSLVDCICNGFVYEALSYEPDTRQDPRPRRRGRASAVFRRSAQRAEKSLWTTTQQIVEQQLGQTAIAATRLGPEVLNLRAFDYGLVEPSPHAADD